MKGSSNYDDQEIKWTATKENFINPNDRPTDQ